MEKYLLTAHDVRGEWRDIENIIKNNVKLKSLSTLKCWGR